MSKRKLFLFFVVIAALIAAIGMPTTSSDSNDNTTQSYGLIVGRNVNMVSGQEFGTGDPYLQRQNEPSIAVSTRNPMHLLAGANDYRTIDEPFEDEVPGHEYGSQAYGKDAWVGVFKSYDGGQSWITTLFPGFPQDTSEEGSYSPLKLFGTAADPVVRAGTNGTFYYAGIAFNRVDRGSGVVFVGRFIDLNNKENGDTIVYDGVSEIDQGNAGQFLDKPWLAVDIPRAGHQSQALFSGQSESIPCGNVYVAYSAFIGKTDKNVRSKILFARSIDCGHNWSTPIKISESQHIDQGAVIAIDPDNGTVYVAWRRFTHPSQPSAIIIVKSTDGGLIFTKPAVVQTLDLSFPPSQDGPFDQRTTELSFRTNSHPTMAVDNDNVVYIAYAERGLDLTSRIVMTYSTDFGSSWTSPTPVDDTVIGHQFMPSLTFAGGKLMLTWYDQRNDISMDVDGCDPSNSDFVEDNPCRHTIDVRVAQINPIYSSSLTSFSSSSILDVFPSKQVSRYLHSYETENGEPIYDESGFLKLIQYQYNFSGLPLFRKGRVPFLGDYIDIAPSPMFLPPSASPVSSSSNSSWTYNTSLSQHTVYHITWADNRDVWIPVLADGITPDLWAENWWSDPYNAPRPGCNENTAGILNQNVYTSCISPGFVAGSPGNTKPLDLEGATDSNEWPIPRAFTVTVKNMTDLEKYYSLMIEAPPGVLASFVQYFDIDPDAEFSVYPHGFPDYGPLLVGIAAHSTLSQPVFVYPADDPQASLRVHVEEVDTTLTSIVILNPDPTNPPIEDPDYYTGPNIKGYEVHDPNIKGTGVITYTTENFLLNPNIKGADLINSDTAAPNIKGPNIKGPNIKGNPLNPNIKGTDVPSPNIKGTSISEISWEIENEGNTTTPYTFDIYTDYEPPVTDDPNDSNYVPPEEAMQFLLLIYKVYTTPVAEGCTLTSEEHCEQIANIPNPNIKGPNIKGTPPTTMRAANNPAEDAKNATFYLKPRVIEQGGDKIKEKVVVKLYAFDPVEDNGDDFDFGTTEEPNANAAVISGANNTEDLENGNYLLPGDSSALFIVNESLPDGEVLQTYTAFLTAYGYDEGDVLTWEIIGGGDLPHNLQLDSFTGEISETPIEAGVFTFTVQVTNTGTSPTQIATKELSLTITAPVGPPTLVSPSEGAELDNGCEPPSIDSIEWDFDWSVVTGSTQYNLYVKHEGPPESPSPRIDEYNITDSTFSHDETGSYIIEDNRDNWRWKVRAKINNLYWTAWSDERSFNVEPLNTDCVVVEEPPLTLEIIGGPNFTVQQSTPTYPCFIGYPPGSKEPLVIAAKLTNTGDETFVGVPSSTYFYKTEESPVFLSGCTGKINGYYINEGDWLRDVPASSPFPGGFILEPGEERTFILHIIYGLIYDETDPTTCPEPEHPLISAPIGEKLTLTDSGFHIGIGELVDGQIVVDPESPQDIYVSAEEESFPIDVTVIAADTGLNITTIKPPNILVGVAYPTTTLTATDGVAPLTWTNIGSLPDGLTLSSDGVISGTPTTPGIFQFAVQATDSSNPPQMDTQVLRIIVVLDNVPNPSFELGEGTWPDGWEPLEPGQATFVWDEDYAYDGLKSVGIGCSGGCLYYNSWMMTDFIAIDRTKDYRLSVKYYWENDPNEDEGITISIYLYDANGGMLIGLGVPVYGNSASENWQEISFTTEERSEWINNRDETFMIKICLQRSIHGSPNTSATVRFDNVSMEEVVTGFSVLGTVYYSTTGLPDVTVKLYDESGTGPPLQTTTTNPSGQYSFAGVANGTYWVGAFAPNDEYIGSKKRSTTVTDGNATRDIDLPKKMTLLTPANGSDVSDTTPELTWEANPEAVRYTVQLTRTDPWELVETGSSTSLSYTVTTELAVGVTYTWQVDGYDDPTGGHHVGGGSETTSTFTVIVPPDLTPPTVTDFDPADDATGVAIDSNLVITFDENVVKDSGNIVIMKSSDDTEFETIDVTDVSKVSISNNIVTIDPEYTFGSLTSYYVKIDDNCFKDTIGNHYAGISDKTTWNFNAVFVNVGNLVAYLPFNGNAHDESGNANHGTINGGATFTQDRFGNPDGAINFDGTDDYVELTNESDFDLTELTIVVLFKIPDYSKRNYLFSKGAEFGNYAMRIYEENNLAGHDGKIMYAHQTSGGNWTPGSPDEQVPQDKFFHVAVTLNSTMFNQYMNGELKRSVPNPTPPRLNDENVTIGKAYFSGLGDQFFLGVIDEVRIYNRALSEFEIQALYSAQTVCIENAPDPWGEGWTNIGLGSQQEQSFLTNSSQIFNVDVDIVTKNSNGGKWIIMKILSPEGVVLAQIAKYVSYGFNGWLGFDIPGGLSVTSGTTLRIQIEEATDPNTFGWKYSSDTYPNGIRYLYGKPEVHSDWYFRVNCR
ncbi:MAG: Ig-like domain-containing protein [Desulfobacteraceae bacterium]|nr:Ig-like domain-containing protein [Desulfobacteraceae bacterium]